MTSGGQHIIEDIAVCHRVF